MQYQLKRLFLNFTLLGFALLSGGASKGVAVTNDSMFKSWFDGGVDAALAAAKRDHKPVLLYWGAVWCPPCNELKSQVFSRPRFAELIAPLIAVALDGDSEQAQLWGDRLKIGGYPTVLLLDSNGHELMRLATSVNIGEFETALTSALATGRPLNQVLDHALTAHATDDEWRMLAYYNWEELTDLTRSSDQLLNAQVRLVKLVPERLDRERALIIAQVLNRFASEAPSVSEASIAEFLASAPHLLTRLLEDPNSRTAARSVLVYSGIDLLAWLYPKASPQQQQADALWVKAMAEVAMEPSASVDLRLWARSAPFQVYLLRHKGEKVPRELRQLVAAIVADADREAKTPYERHAVISGAASLLLKAGDAAGARKLLDHELAHTNTPWYYQSSYAHLEQAEGQDEAALAWSQKARESVQGRASRLQWITEDLVMTSTVKSANQNGRLLALIKEYYDTALSLPDGFLGRNAKRAERVAAQLRPRLSQGKIGATLKQYAEACKSGKVASGCDAHFTALLKESI